MPCSCQRLAALAAAFCCLAVAARGQTPNAPTPPPLLVSEDFESNPASRGWSVFGNPRLFAWNPPAGGLDVTWDSSSSNSYYQLPLGTVLTRRDDFSADVDLTLREIAAGVDPEKPGTFQIALGFLNGDEARRPGFIRGTARSSPDLVEFDFFPDTGFGPTVWPGVFSTNSTMNYNGTSDFNIFDLPTGIPLRIHLGYAASNATATVTITTNGVPVGPPTSARLMPRFSEFLVDTFAIASYSDAGQSPFMPGSVFARGTIDRIELQIPPPPIARVEASLTGGVWEGTFATALRWAYDVESSTNLRDWTPASSPRPGTGAPMTLSVTAGETPGARFYRVIATPLLSTP